LAGGGGGKKNDIWFKGVNKKEPRKEGGLYGGGQRFLDGIDTIEGAGKVQECSGEGQHISKCFPAA